jgi:biopolymer transport protein ExbD
MPVHIPGPRLLSSIKFKYLVKGAGSSSGPRAANVSLNLTPFVDMMTILVTFLLMVFSSSGELLTAQKGLELPLAITQADLQMAPIIVIDKTDIKFINGPTPQQIATVDATLKDEGMKIEALSERLEAANKAILQGISDGKLPKDLKEACAAARNNKRALPGHICPAGLAILQADKDTDAKLINKVVLTAKFAGFDNLLFAVKNK